MEYTDLKKKKKKTSETIKNAWFSLSLGLIKFE